MIEQLPAGGQVLQHTLQLLAIERTPGSTAIAGAERRQQAIGVDFREAEIDALASLIILIIAVDTTRDVLAGIFPKAVSDRLFDRAERHCRSSIRQSLNRFDTVLFEDALHPADGVALAIKQPADALEQIDIVGAIVTPAAAPLHRLDLGKPGFPEPQDGLRNIEIVRDLADGSERIRRLVQRLAPCRSPVK